MAITVLDPEEGKRQKQALMVQQLQMLGQLSQLPGQLQKSKQEGMLAQAQAEMLRQVLPQLGGAPRPTTPLGPFGTPPIAPQTSTSGIGLTGFGFGPSGLSVNFGQTPQSKSAQKLAEKQAESSDKLKRAIKTMAVIKKKYDEAFPNVDGAEELPLKQRVEGFRKSMATKTGIEANPKVTSLERQGPLYARQIIRDFGEVGNIPTSDVEDAAKSIKTGGQTEKERNQIIADFVEVALSRVDEQSARQILNDPNVQDVLETVGLDLSSYGVNTAARNVPPAIQQVAAANGWTILGVTPSKEKKNGK